MKNSNLNPVFEKILNSQLGIHKVEQDNAYEPRYDRSKTPVICPNCGEETLYTQPDKCTTIDCPNCIF